MEPYIGQIQPYGFGFTPRGWAFCDGQLIAIATNTALFSLLGTTYGGNGQTTFALPDLRGRSMVHPGSGPGLSNITWGEQSGVESVTVLISNMPMHTHALNVANVNGSVNDPTTAGGVSFSKGPVSGSGPNASVLRSYTTDTAATPMKANTIGVAGGSVPLAIRNPFLGIYHSIALQGIFPSRD